MATATAAALLDKQTYTKPRLCPQATPVPNPLQPGGAATAAAFLPTVTPKAPPGAPPPPPRERRHFDPRDEAATAGQIAAAQAADRAPAPAPAAQDNGCHAVQGYYAVRCWNVPPC